MHGESASVDITSENIQNELRKIEELLGPCDPANIMNFDETGLYYQQPLRMTICSELLDGLKILNVAFGRQSRKIALLLDSASVHKTRILLNNIKLIFLLANTTSKLQDLDVRIIDNFKAHFRAQQYDRALCLYISKKLDNPNVYKMDQAQAMVFLANEWLKVKPETINGMLPDLPKNFDNKVTDVSQLNLEADESEMIVCYTTSTTNNEETAEGNIDETEENDNTEQDEQCVDIVECKNRLREAYETIIMYEVPLDDLDRKLHCRIRMRLADSCAELNVKRANRSSILFYKPYLPEKFDQSHVDHIADKIKCYEMKDDTLSMYESILDLMESENLPIELALLQIDTFKAKFLKTEGRTTEGYTMLKVVEYLLETLNDWRQDDSETTIYRRIATIFDFMFRDTHVKLAEETACDRSKHKRQYNAIVFGASSTDRELCGRKIDLLVRYGRDTKDLELSSNEFKKPSITASNAITQQCKNLRVNGAILNHLHGLNKKIDSLLAMDWIGSTGYIYCLVAHHGIYVAKFIDILTIPTSVNGLLEFKNTLRLLFAYKDFTLRIGIIAEHSLKERRKVDRFREVIDVAVATPSPTLHHELFFTPTMHRVKKTKTENNV
ncbi:hypothetical protein G6F54_006276 [Rhizopus delemar]|nr:hypothetical protein G6F54_006276 [Rhizopus delemar]